MGVGYGIKSNGDSLIFAIDAASQQNLTDKGFNRLSNGAFVNGADATPSGGHNAQNDIVQFENPGDSTYVLRQTMGIAQTEYQCNPTIPSGTSTPICMSGWYAQSLDYNASSRMFHSRAYSSSGSHTSLGTGIGTQIGEPVNINGISWTHRYTILNSPSDATGTFNWYVGYAGDSYTGARYYTNLKVQDGRSPCPNDICGNYHVSRNYATYNSANKAWDFNGTDAYMDTTGFTPQTIPNCTIEALVYDTKASGYRAIVQHNVAGDDALYINPNNYLMWWPATASTLTVPSNQWVYVAASHQAGVGITYCVNGVTQFVSGNFADPQDWDFIRIGGHSTGDGERWKGQIRMARIHNRNLSADELKQNYHAVKNRT